MYTEKQARAAAYILTRNGRIQYLPQSSADEEWTQEQGYKYTQVYAWGLVVSGIWQWEDWSSHNYQTLC